MKGFEVIVTESIDDGRPITMARIFVKTEEEALNVLENERLKYCDQGFCESENRYSWSVYLLEFINIFAIIPNYVVISGKIKTIKE